MCLEGPVRFTGDQSYPHRDAEALEHNILTGLGFRDLRQESIREERSRGQLRDRGLEEKMGCRRVEYQSHEGVLP